MDHEKQGCEITGCSCDGKANIFEMNNTLFLDLHDNWIPLYRGEIDMNEIVEAIKRYCENNKV